MENKNLQRAGKGSLQLQTQNVNVNVGISEERAREIFKEQFALQAKDLSTEAKIEAANRIGKFEGELMSKFTSIQGALDFFKKPEFQYLIALAEKTAIQTDDSDDYVMLSNLLANKTQKSDDKKFGTGVREAIEIVNEVDDDSLQGLTAIYVLTHLSSRGNNCKTVLDTLDNLLGSVIYQSLPNGENWTDQLDVLKCVRKSEISTNKILEDYYYDQYQGIFANGIDVSSVDYKNAISLLKTNNLPVNILVNHDFIKTHVRLDVQNESDIENLYLVNNMGQKIYLTTAQLSCLHNIYSMYNTDSSVTESIKKQLITEIENRPNLKMVRKWWNAFPHHLEITIVGKVLGFSKAKILNPTIPDIFN